MFYQTIPTFEDGTPVISHYAECATREDASFSDGWENAVHGYDHESGYDIPRWADAWYWHAGWEAKIESDMWKAIDN